MSSIILGHENALRPWDLLPLARTLNAERNHRDRSDSAAELVGSFDPTAFAEDEANRLLAITRDQVERLLREAREEAAETCRTARLQGLDEGRAEGLKAVEAEQARLAEMSAGIQNAFADFCAQQVPQLADLAILAAERLVCEELALEPHRVTAIILQAIDHLAGSQQICLRVNPADFPFVESCQTLRAERDSGRVELLADPEVERAGCRITSEQGEVDASLSGRLLRLREELTGDRGD